jgi:PHD/YefM family antitoxin component YafN of YafNO toxin-antitoxin module
MKPKVSSMRYAATSDTEPKLVALLEAAQNEPVFIERDQQEVAVLVSARDYDRLSGKATREFLEFCDTIADNAAAKGLTEAKLEELLKDA